jgi:hypothetical protein
MKKFFPFLEDPSKGAPPPPMFPKTGPLWKQTSISRALLSISFGVPSKGALPPGSPHRAASEIDAPNLEPSFIFLAKSPIYEPPSRFPSGAPMERDAHFQGHLYPSSRTPSKGALPPGSPHRAPTERETPHF